MVSPHSTISSTSGVGGGKVNQYLHFFKFDFFKHWLLMADLKQEEFQQNSTRKSLLLKRQLDRREKNSSERRFLTLFTFLNFKMIKLAIRAMIM